jgi:hypothetical protein
MTYVTDRCFGCKQPFSFDPEYVPRVPIADKLRPVCEECMVRANTRRKEKGLQPLLIQPEAYEPA